MSKRRMGTSGRATLARLRIAGACQGTHTAEFSEWRSRAQELAAEHRRGVRVPHASSQQTARHQGWLSAEQEFRREHPERIEGLIGFSSSAAETPIPLSEEIRWAYRHAAVYSTTEADAPSPGAWLWLQEARQNRSQFLGRVFAVEQATHSGKLPTCEDKEASDVAPLPFDFESLLGPKTHSAIE